MDEMQGWQPPTPATDPVNSPPASTVPNRWSFLAVQFIAWLVLWLGLLRLPQPPPIDSDLDPSWQLALSYIAYHGIRFGNNIAFTYGPLGFQECGVYAGGGFWMLMVTAAAFAGILAWALLECIRPQGWPARIAAILMALLLTAPYAQPSDFLGVLLLVLLLFTVKPPRLSTIAIAGLFLAFLSLIKFTDFLLAALSVVLIAGYYLVGRDFRRAAVVTGGFAVGLLVCWMISGQALSGLIPYLRSSLQISGGYADAMSAVDRAFEWISPASVLLLGLYALFEGAAAKWSARSVPTMLIFLAVTWLAWKHAIIRGDGGHRFGLYNWAVAAVALNSIIFSGPRRWHWARAGILAVICSVAIAGIVQVEPQTFAGCVPAFAARVRENFVALANIRAFQASLSSSYATVALANSAPRTIRAVGQDSVDVFGYQQSAAIFDGLNYDPRPLIQSYVAYSLPLQQLDRAFMAGPEAPLWVLQRYESLNHHYPASEDALALRAMLDQYTFQFQDDGFIVWRRTADKTLTELPPPVIEGDAHINQDIKLPGNLDNSDVWLEIDYAYSNAGWLRNFLYKPVPVTLSAAMSDQPQQRRKYSLPQQLAHAGMLLSPLLDTEYDFLRYAVGLGGPQVVSFKVGCAHADEKYLKRTFHYRLRVLPAPSNLAANSAMAASIRQYPLFEIVPTHVESASPPVSVRFSGSEVLQIPAPSKIEFPAPASGGRLQGGFAVRTISDQNPLIESSEMKSPAAEFRITLRDAGIQRVLFDRTLQPNQRPADSGVQTLDIPLPPTSPGATLTASADPVSRGKTADPLTCWTGLRVSAQQAARAPDASK